ncbi:beta-ketoacyl synthase N-terminal-like domain-containing protein [Streptomyces sp. BBFR109]|uniref:beta-ketoacyl synthase N-terminal-like domain-containing protein n=1 Tax=Streptomyces sp. BBFR109 TaxID=3448172 RepID=UPI003F758268
MTRPDRAALRAALAEELHRRHGIRPGELADDRPLAELGVTSRDAVALAARLGELSGAALPATLLWETPTVGALLTRLTDGEPRHAPVKTPAVEASSAVPAGEAAVAVIGVGCRLPGGVRSAADFWRLLCEGRDAVGQVPDGRWTDFLPPGGEPPADIARHGAYLGPVDGPDGIARFDAEFFGVSAPEAQSMDPQQRILLEVVREALDHAAVPADSLAGTRTGVFVGVGGNEYAHLTAAELDAVGGWTATGVSPSVTAGRVSYLLDLRGPSVAVDTACSSSLVAVQQAVRSLAAGDSDTALAAGVNLLLSPAATLSLQRAGALSAEGRCKAFDAAADGISRGEGCGVVVLKRLADAERDGDRVLAVIEHAVVNQDGRSNGLTAPSAGAQRALLEAAHRAPADVDYVEAHGTGTPLGDPIEAGALGAVLGAGRSPDRPLLIGSVKTNLGHLEAAAGITGLIKTVLSLHHGRIPPHLHYTTPNPHIDPERLGLRVVTATEPWPRYSGAARAGVSAFGFSGTNAHVALREHRPATRPKPPRPADRPAVLLLDAPTEDRLRDQARELADWLAGPAARAVRPADLGRTLAGRTGRGRRRLAVVARERAGITRALRRFAAGEADEHLVTGSGAVSGPGAVWVFSGYGSQWPRMARGLLTAEPTFAAEVDALDGLLQAAAGVSLRDALLADTLPDTTDVVMPVLFGVQVALARLWSSYGLRPAAVIGHSLGEIAAAVVAGALDVETGARVVAARSRLMATVDGGAMAVLDRSESELDELTREFPSVQLAVHSSPRHSVVAGDADEVAALVARITEAGGFARPLPVSIAGHTRDVDPLLGALARELGRVRATVPHTRRYTSVLDDPRSEALCDTDYWLANLRRPVRFTQAVRAAAEDGHRVFVEVAPHPTQLHPLTETLRAAGAEDALVTGTLRRGTDDALSFRTALAGLLVGGLPLPGARESLHPHGRITDLPSPRWRHRTFWPGRTPEPDATAPVLEPGTHDPLSRLRACVAEVTGHSTARLDPDLPLTELGLDSLMAQRIRTAVEREFAVTVEPAVLLNRATLRTVAALLPQDDDGRDTASTATRSPRTGGGAPRLLGDGGPGVRSRSVPGRLRTFAGDGPGAPLFLAHAAGGLSDVYEPLALRLDGVRPVLGFDRTEDEDEVTARAAEFARRIREARPEGGWLLGGWSYGGLVAQEAARLLAAEGEVTALVLFDSVLPLPAPRLTADEQAHRRFAGFAAYVRQVYGAELRLPYEELAGMSDADQIGHVLKLLEQAVELPPAVLEHQRTSYLDLRGAERHTPGPYAGRTLLYRASEPAPHTVRDERYERTDESLGWDAYCADLTVSPLPGHHLALLDPPVVDTLAELLRRDLPPASPGFSPLPPHHGAAS